MKSLDSGWDYRNRTACSLSHGAWGLAAALNLLAPSALQGTCGSGEFSTDEIGKSFHVGLIFGLAEQ